MNEQAAKSSNMWLKPQHSRSISSLKSERKRMIDRELVKENIRQLARLQNAKASFDVIKMNRAEKSRQKLLGNMK